MTEATSAAAADEAAAAPVQTVTFKGEKFELTNEGVSEIALMEFAMAVTDEEEAGSMQSLASLLRFVLELIAPNDRNRFRSVARRTRAGVDDLLELLQGEVEAETERPTGLSTGSSGGPEITPEKSDVNFGGRGSPLAGRPDLLIAVEDAIRAA